ncbi:branched-chain-amino-acid aminotransferase mitochondrial [Biomphalaria glabrata]|nr:branched-chain-amino-acid aminotransferase; mitochondrial-like; partial [Biomphalaria glabrata]
MTKTPALKPDEKIIKFGSHFSDHMLEINWSEEKGWGVPKIKPTTSFQMHPASKVLQYASQAFEGLKAYRCVDGQIRLFRPNENCRRLKTSAQRIGLPDFDQIELLRCLKKLISIDHEWVPQSINSSLYIRPTFIGTEPTLGVNNSSMAKLFVITSPVGSYFPTALEPLGLLADPHYIRAWPGGCGSYKISSNYAPTVPIQSQALKKYGCQQMLWLFGDDHQMTEAGTMNLFIYWVNEQGEKELITPPLDSGLVLPGITRKSILELCLEWKEFKVSEKSISMKTFSEALKLGRVKEVFGAGTACVVCPVNKILYLDQELSLKIDTHNSLTQRIYKELIDIHYYRKPHHWMEDVDDEEESITERG